MKRFVLTLVLASAACLAQAADVGVSVSIGEPGFYGRIDIGNYPRPAVFNTRPIVVDRGPNYVSVAPIYLRVPPGHRKRWSRYCHEYRACGRPVIFVQDRWYNEVYVPTYRKRHGNPHDARRNERRDDRRDGRRDDRRDDDGPGHGHGRD